MKFTHLLTTTFWFLFSFSAFAAASAQSSKSETGAETAELLFTHSVKLKFRVITEEVLVRIMSMISPDTVKILELGSGDGATSALLANAKARAKLPGELVLSDLPAIADTWREHASKSVPGANYISLSYPELPELADASIAVAIDVLSAMEKSKLKQLFAAAVKHRKSILAVDFLGPHKTTAFRLYGEAKDTTWCLPILNRTQKFWYISRELYSLKHDEKRPSVVSFVAKEAEDKSIDILLPPGITLEMIENRDPNLLVQFYEKAIGMQMQVIPNVTPLTELETLKDKLIHEEYELHAWYRKFIQKLAEENGMNVIIQENQNVQMQYESEIIIAYSSVLAGTPKPGEGPKLTMFFDLMVFQPKP